ncbi:MAG TPA: deaminase [Candidatus Nanoarchaeia archaeon]|nr:deaminase [Candidatus Nanoarchaeia archaeon]
MRKALIAYVPVLHAGYVELFRRHSDGSILILGQQLVDELLEGHKEIRAVDPRQMTALLARAQWFREAVLLTPPMASLLGETYKYGVNKLTLPNEQISRRFAERYLPNAKVTFEDIFLRWDADSVFSQTDVNYDRVSTDPRDRELMALADEEAAQSLCWWRQVGGYVARDGELLWVGHNEHLPSAEAHYAEGDPRDLVPAGTDGDIATTLHVEQAIVAWAASTGTSLKGADIGVTVYPCPLCAKLIAYSGISRVFFKTGHASLDGESILKDKGVEIIIVT